MTIRRKRRANEDKLSLVLQKMLAEDFKLSRRRANEDRVSMLAEAMLGEALQGHVWAASAIWDATEGTVDGRPLPLDLDALVHEDLTVEEILKRIRAAYDRD